MVTTHFLMIVVEIPKYISSCYPGCLQILRTVAFFSSLAGQGIGHSGLCLQVYIEIMVSFEYRCSLTSSASERTHLLLM
jgi:hypothetical protein